MHGVICDATSNTVNIHVHQVSQGLIDPQTTLY